MGRLEVVRLLLAHPDTDVNIASEVRSWCEFLSNLTVSRIGLYLCVCMFNVTRSHCDVRKVL
jgi:hypothetical protein